MTRVPRTSLASRAYENDTESSAHAQEHIACFLVDLRAWIAQQEERTT